MQTAITRRRLVTQAGLIAAAGAAVSIAPSAIAQQAPSAEMLWRYLAFLHAERRMLGRELGAERDGGFFVMESRLVNQFYMPWYIGDPSHERAGARSVRVLSSAGVSLDPDDV